MKNLVYIYDGTFEGLLTSIFIGFENKERPVMVSTEHGLQIAFGQQVRFITTELEKAKRVEEGFRRVAGDDAMQNATITFYSDGKNSDYTVFRYIFIGFKYGYRVNNMLTHPDVLPIMEARLNVTREAQHIKGFLRFSKMINGVFFARIKPKNNVLPLIMWHFIDRFSVQPFVIYDANHKLAGIYNLKNWEILETGEINIPELAQGEEQWLELWKSFCSAVFIKERENPKQQMTMCPKRFWDDMPEMREYVVPKAKEKVLTNEKQRAISNNKQIICIE